MEAPRVTLPAGGRAEVSPRRWALTSVHRTAQTFTEPGFTLGDEGGGGCVPGEDQCAPEGQMERKKTRCHPVVNHLIPEGVTGVRGSQRVAAWERAQGTIATGVAMARIIHRHSR